jgi:hypothetical protein
MTPKWAEGGARRSGHSRGKKLDDLMADPSFLVAAEMIMELNRSPRRRRNCQQPEKWPTPPGRPKIAGIL